LPGRSYNRAARLQHGLSWPLTMITPDWCGKPLFVGAYPGLVAAGLDSVDGPLRAWGITRLVNATSDQPSAYQFS